MDAETDSSKKPNYRMWIALIVTIAALGLWSYMWAPSAQGATAGTNTTGSTTVSTSSQRCPNNMNCGDDGTHYRNNDYRYEPPVAGPPLSAAERTIYECAGAAAIGGLGAAASSGVSIPWSAGLAGASCGWGSAW